MVDEGHRVAQRPTRARYIQKQKRDFTAHSLSRNHVCLGLPTVTYLDRADILVGTVSEFEYDSPPLGLPTSRLPPG